MNITITVFRSNSVLVSVIDTTEVLFVLFEFRSGSVHSSKRSTLRV